MAARLKAGARVRTLGRRLPPAARRPPGDRQQRADRCGSSASSRFPGRSAKSRVATSGRSAARAEPIPAAELFETGRQGARPRAARLRRRARADLARSAVVTGAGASDIHEAIEPRSGRLPDRRAVRARDGRRPRRTHPLHRGRPLRNRDLRGEAPRETDRRTLRGRTRVHRPAQSDLMWQDRPMHTGIATSHTPPRRETCRTLTSRRIVPGPSPTCCRTRPRVTDRTVPSSSRVTPDAWEESTFDQVAG